MQHRPIVASRTRNSKITGYTRVTPRTMALGYGCDRSCRLLSVMVIEAA